MQQESLYTSTEQKTIDAAGNSGGTNLTPVTPSQDAAENHSYKSIMPLLVGEI